MRNRTQIAQGPPSRGLASFPCHGFDGFFFRASRRKPWWFCSKGDCRFDIGMSAKHDLGTLYAGVDVITGVLEKLGPEFLGAAVALADLESFDVWEIGYDQPIQLADIGSSSAIGFGVTNELPVMVPYDVPQEWAEAFVAAGWEGILYRTRFSLGLEPTGIAVFDQRGTHDEWASNRWGNAADQEIIDELEARGIEVIEPLSSTQLTFM